MFTRYRTRGFIIKKTDRGESDRVFTIFTKDFGKLELLAKAERKIKSKLRGGLELFYLSEVEFIQGKAQKTLTDAILIDGFKNLRKNLKRLALAQRISEVLDGLVREEEEEEKIWRLLERVFQALGNYPLRAKEYELLYYHFLWNLLSILGYKPELFQCSLCQGKLNPEDIYFSSREGGLICGECRVKSVNPEKIDADTVKILRIILQKEWRALNKLRLKEENFKSLKEVSNHYLSEVLSQFE